ncbi:MAG: OmpA family protein [Acidobacteria bacterium]|nr:OmpA family protein [Acidobacteriota bacterium]
MENKIAEEEPKPRPRIKKAKGHGGHHGGAWKVAYADFVTAMMALFLVLWLVSQADMKLKQAIAAYFRSPGVFDTMQGGILSQAKKVSKEPDTLTSKDDEQVLFSIAQTLQKKFESRPEFAKIRDRVKIEVTEEGLKIQIVDKAEQVSFPSGSAKLTPEAEAILNEIAAAICGLPNQINIGGHTDSRPFSTDDNNYTNWELSADRANAARRVLESNCVKPEQIRRIVGYADTEPLVPNDPFAPANRRISITVLRLAAPATTTGLANDKNKTVVDDKIEKEKQILEKSSPLPQKNDANSNSSKISNTDEKKLMKTKLQNDGAVVVGTPDKTPEKPRDK